jgi:hypothetical protein
MKRFLLFAGYTYYPSGGMEDLIGDFQTPEGARDKLVEVLEKGGVDWAHIYDTETMAMVYEL